MDQSEQTEEPKEETPRNRTEDITVDSDNDDVSIYPRPSRSVASRLTPRNLINSRGASALKWIFGLAVIILLINLMPRDLRNPRVKQIGKSVVLLWNEETPVLECSCIMTISKDYATSPIDAVIVNADRSYSLLGLEKIRLTPNFLLIYAAKYPLTLAQNPLMQHSEFYFNFTMTYRSDSDLIMSEYYFSTLFNVHETVKKFEQPDRNFMRNVTDHLASKIRYQLNLKSLWAVYITYESNVYTKPQSNYLKEFRRHMELDGIKTCHELNECLPYKFMLIFDISFCPDFVHSQVYMAMANFVVPVLIGSSDISHLVPPDSYINADELLSPGRLAQFLSNVGSYPHLYEQYFWWHSKYQLHQIRQPYCDLCNELKKPRRVRQPEEFQNWWTRYKCEPSTQHIDWPYDLIPYPSMTKANNRLAGS